MEKKRETLAAEARQMVKDGVDFKPSELPRSFRTDDSSAPIDTDAKAEPAASPENDSQTPVVTTVPKSHHESPFAGTSLDGKRMLEEYKRTKTKKEASGATEAKTDSQGVA